MSVLFAFGLAVCAIMIGLLLGMLIGYFGERRHCRRMEARAEHEQRAWLARPKIERDAEIRRAVNQSEKIESARASCEAAAEHCQSLLVDTAMKHLSDVALPVGAASKIAAAIRDGFVIGFESSKAAVATRADSKK